MSFIPVWHNGNVLSTMPLFLLNYQARSPKGFKATNLD